MRAHLKESQWIIISRILTALVLVEDSDEEEAFVPVTIPPEEVNHPVYWEEPKFIIKRKVS